MQKRRLGTILILLGALLLAGALGLLGYNQWALPVMSEWSYPGLKIAPGRYAGSVFTDDLVICGHNYARHFSPVKRLAVGTTVQFVDMDGREWDYTVSKVETLQPTQIEEMVGKADGDDWDLTLFTCTTGGSARCAVRCTRVETAS